MLLLQIEVCALFLRGFNEMLRCAFLAVISPKAATIGSGHMHLK